MYRIKINKRENRSVFFLLCVFFLSISGSFAQTIEQAYDLRFQTLAGLTEFTPYYLSFDSTQITDHHYHPRKLIYNNARKSSGSNKVYSLCEENQCCLIWSKTVVLPDKIGKEKCSITLNYQSEIEDLRFFATVLDKKEQVLYTDSVVLPVTDGWTDHSFAFFGKESGAVNIVLLRKGGRDEDEGKSIYLNRISVRVGNCILNDLSIDSLVDSSAIGLDQGSIVPLSLQNNASLAGINDWKDKKIIALGDAISGMKNILEARIQFAKYLITSENCKLLMLDLPEDLCMRWNLYLQGKWSETYEAQLKEELTNIISGPTLWFEFLQWIRKYNTQAITPVRVMGIQIYSGFSNFLTDYLLYFSTSRQDSIEALTAVHRRSRQVNVVEYISRSQIPDELSREELHHLLRIVAERDRSMPFGPPIRRYSGFGQAKRIAQAVDSYLSPEEKAILFTSSSKINKRYPILDTEDYNKSTLSLVVDPDSLGSYLSHRYGEQYHAVSFQIGERTCLVDSVANHDDGYGSIENRFYPVEQKNLFPYAFERAAMNSSLPYFYYPTDRLPSGILGLNIITDWRWWRRNHILFRYGYLPAHFDALVFVHEAKGMRDIVDYDYNLEFTPEIVVEDQLLKELEVQWKKEHERLKGYNERPKGYDMKHFTP